ncbi:hypothetical protein NQ015_09975 [Corynebacterium sp. 153RC1]|uniref:hypothetical protein n=1 Tax=unclassified Corynebacterium TaxID=2624378 RepID=UPI00211C5445|nr:MULTISPECIES: hypothetical protein [unclassified Corynebacterium]MCQ9371380.1 hypothetical protein [Corynebacterium sp. 35RC1]MCQ9353302.1 hypothetical protein [Corynebacterium sp. 209RC1]MCQ9355558.1 hypothetical protein [Corynebacterium sp. 1222RC1]MCQ9357743.1 hypothetical protein [Corynebacterium sp. 122RC1]MCQ9359930.1 hypothetical protein [Corynebacterium sp. 142RC1]
MRAARPTLKFGRVKFGAKQTSELAAALPLAIVLALVIGAIAGWLHESEQPSGWLVFCVFAAATFVPCLPLAWVLAVDRESLAINEPNAEQSVEVHWAQAAAANSFYLAVAFAGSACAVASILGYLPIAQALLAGLLVLMGLFVACYFRQRLHG